MSRLSPIVSTIRKAAALMLLPLLASSCHWMNEDYDCEETADSRTPQYINVTIAVSASDSPVTRAPLGGEYGDGTEKGIDTRENEVKDITLIFYRDNAGINTTSDDAEVLCVKRYDVRPFEAATDMPSNHTHKNTEPQTGYYDKEVLYTTGNQRLDETELVIGETYNVLVVANSYVDIKVGDKINEARERVFSSIYTGTGIGTDATHFVMSSETDATVTLTNPTPETSNGENTMTYYFDCIHIERLAARIDYCTRGGTYEEYTDPQANAGAHPGPNPDDKSYKGYKYIIDNQTGSFFVVTKVTPFNLYNENEFVFKRIRNNWSDATPAITFLGDESTTNYVVDPYTATKTGTDRSYLNRINALLGPGNNNNPYTQVMADVQSTDALVEDSNEDLNVIIGYPRENTLHPQSLLKTYATGIAFEIKYYENANARPQTHTYYHYLRHQGEETTGIYEAKELKRDILDADNATCGSSPAMNYGVVRNNIYRIYVETLNPQYGTLKIRIEEEKWRHVDNPVIYL